MAIKERGRSGKLSLYRRVPKRYEAVEPRKFVWVALETDSRALAGDKAVRVWDQMIEAWEAKLAGDTSDAAARFEAARELAKSRGFRYLAAPAVAKLPTDELLARVEAVGERRGEPDALEARALLGGAAEPSLTIGGALEAYWGLTQDRQRGKSPDQLRRWRNPRVKAIRNLIAVVGDKALDRLTRDDMLDFRAWWSERIVEEDLTPDSANKDLIHAGDVLKTVNAMKRLGLDLPLEGLALKGGEKAMRPPFSSPWIRDRLLADGVLDGLNPEARAVLLAMVNTGARPSEIAALRPTQIRLSGTVPHISIEPVDRQLKSHHARRVIPLTGVSLAALQAFPEGFPRYRESSASLSAVVNKYLRAHGLLETERHSLYSLRHAFEDRMLEAGIDDRIRRDLLGHRLTRERYGKGASLGQVQALLQPLAF